MNHQKTIAGKHMTVGDKENTTDAPPDPSWRAPEAERAAFDLALESGAVADHLRARVNDILRHHAGHARIIQATGWYRCGGEWRQVQIGEGREEEAKVVRVMRVGRDGRLVDVKEEDDAR